MKFPSSPALLSAHRKGPSCLPALCTATRLVSPVFLLVNPSPLALPSLFPSLRRHANTATPRWSSQQTFLQPTVVFAPEVQDTVFDDFGDGSLSFSFDFDEGVCRLPVFFVIL